MPISQTTPAGISGTVAVSTSALPTGASSETTLASVKTAVEIIDNFISGSKGLVTEDNSAAIKAKTDNLDVLLSTVATQATLALIKAKTDNIPAQGQALAAASTPVVLTAAQVSTLTPPAAITGFSTETTLAGAATSLAVLDDWDESDRAKVNPIAGQAGVQGGSGTVSALTQRVVLATDVALPAGTNAIGKLAANSGVDIGDVDVTSLPALAVGTNRVGATYATGGQIVDETGTVRAVSRSFVDATASGNTAVVAAQGAGVRIRVLSAKVVTATALTVRFQSASTNISPAESLAANGGFVLPRNVDGWFQTAANEALNINLSGAGTVGCTLTWVPAT